MFEKEIVKNRKFGNFEICEIRISRHRKVTRFVLVACVIDVLCNIKLITCKYVTSTSVIRDANIE